jgi:hypothetical protein
LEVFEYARNDFTTSVQEIYGDICKLLTIYKHSKNYRLTNLYILTTATLTAFVGTIIEFFLYVFFKGDNLPSDGVKISTE